MTTHRVKITSDGVRHAVHIDGVDVSGAIHDLRLHMEPRNLAEVDLTLLPGAVDFDGYARIGIDDATGRLLLTLGWTPPATEVEHP